MRVASTAIVTLPLKKEATPEREGELFFGLSRMTIWGEGRAATEGCPYTAAGDGCMGSRLRGNDEGAGLAIHRLLPIRERRGKRAFHPHPSLPPSRGKGPEHLSFVLPLGGRVTGFT